MSNVLRLAMVDPNDGTREKLKAMLLRIDTVWLEADCSRYEFFPDVVEQTSPDVGVLALDSDANKTIAMVERLSKEHPECVLLVVSGSNDGQLILRAIRAGAREFLTLPLSEDELESALTRVSLQKFGSADSKRGSCEVIAVAGATGGVGSTSVASNMGCILASEPGKSVALLDLDLALGDADVFLNVIPDYTLADVVQNVARLDIQLLKKSLTKHASGLYLLPRPVELHDTNAITAESLRKVIGLLKASFTHLIVDLSKGYSNVDMSVMEAANKVLLVTQLDLPCLRNVVRLMMSFEEIEGLKQKIEIVVNRAGLDSGQISLKKAKETIGREIYALLPNDYRTMVSVRNNGVPLITQAPKAPITMAMREMVAKLGGENQAEMSVAADEVESNESRWKKFWPGSSKPKA
ncbi:MAG: AAA family ATPase [Planctomycetaceae bacterium]